MDLSDLSIDDLDFTLVPQSRGARSEVVHSFVREITEDDLGTLLSQDLGSETPSLMKLKTSHHKLAQLLAEGVSAVEASLITGYSQSRISILQRDPAFAELLAHYAGNVKEIFISVHERLASLGTDALEELHRRLEEDPEAMSNKELMDLVGLSYDRAGYGPKSTQVHEHKFGLDALLSSVKDEIRKKSDDNIKTLDVRPNKPQAPSGANALPGPEVKSPAGDHPAISASRSEGGGQAVREEGWEEPSGTVVPFPGSAL